MYTKGGPHCTICMSDANIELLVFSPHRFVTKMLPNWGPPQPVREPVDPMVYYRCPGGRMHETPHEAWVQVSKSWTPPPGVPRGEYPA